MPGCVQCKEQLLSWIGTKPGPTIGVTHHQPRTPRGVLRGESPKRFFPRFLIAEKSGPAERSHQAGKPAQGNSRRTRPYACTPYKKVEKWGKESPKEGPSPSLWNPPRWCWVAVRQISPGPGSLLLFLRMPPHRATMAAGPSGQVVSLSGPFLGAATVPSRRNPGFRQPRTAATLPTKALEGRQRTACLAVYNARSNCFPGLARNQGRP